MIVKVKKKKNEFCQISNALLNDSRLSLRARGLAAMLISKPENWQVSIEVLVRECKEGRDAIQGCFRELKTFGYADLKAYKNEAGDFAGKQWTIHEEPLTDGRPEKRLIRSSTDGLKNGPSEKRTVVKTGCEIITQKETNTDLSKNKEGESPANVLKKLHYKDKPVDLNTDDDLYRQVSQFYQDNKNEWDYGVCQVAPGRYDFEQLKAMLKKCCANTFIKGNKYMTFSEHHTRFKMWIMDQPAFAVKTQVAAQADPTKNYKRYS